MSSIFPNGSNNSSSSGVPTAYGKLPTKRDLFPVGVSGGGRSVSNSTCFFHACEVEKHLEAVNNCDDLTDCVKGCVVAWYPTVLFNDNVRKACVRNEDRDLHGWNLRIFVNVNILLALVCVSRVTFLLMARVASDKMSIRSPLSKMSR